MSIIKKKKALAFTLEYKNILRYTLGKQAMKGRNFFRIRIKSVYMYPS